MRNVHLICLLCFVVGRLAIAQDYPKAEVYGGYSYVNIDTNGLSSRQSANGWEASVSGNFNKWLAAEADVSGYYKTYPVNLQNLGLGIVNVKVTDYSYAAGPRINIRPLFIHALVGGDHLTGSALGFSASQDGLVGAFGGGVEWPISSRLAVRSSVDYVFTRHNIFGGPSYTQNNVRVGVGIAYSFGGTRHDAKAAKVAKAQPAETPNTNPQFVTLSALGVVVSLGSSEGAEITEVAPGGAAAAAGLQPGDVINSVDGKHVKNPAELASELSSRTAGDKVQLGYLHRGAWDLKTAATLGGK
jgi:membrane-associated protease RseP (regulator of RpoE activity)